LAAVETARDQFIDRGWAILEHVLDGEECRNVLNRVEQIAIDAAGVRNLLDCDWCASLARDLRSHPAIAPLLTGDGESMVAVQCTLFEKSGDKNWLVGLHQDLSIPVADKIEHPELAGWSRKEGIWFVQPPARVLSRLIAIRLHLDPCGPQDGPLKVVSRSHDRGRLDDDAISALRQSEGETVCSVGAGDALLLRPLLLHASSKSSGISRRRVLHFLFGPPQLPCGLKWHNAIA
jgi:ectoine hydroxylase-related dioxygenase (phytanoyl-CoA dioxygenase family)